MSDIISKTLASTPVVPLVQANDPDVALSIAKALIEGGLTVLEVVLRTPEALDCMEHLAKNLPDAHVGAGTVLTAGQTEDVIRRGAKFVVSPGLDPASVGICQEAGLPIYPGVVTATEMQQAYNLGLRAVKFFPAGLAGGPKMLKAFSSVFQDVRIMPTGGVNAANLPDYLAVPAVIACGGSWLTPAEAIKSGDFGAITKLAKEAVEIAAPYAT